mgnify:CR=1 FL=1
MKRQTSRWTQVVTERPKTTESAYQNPNPTADSRQPAIRSRCQSQSQKNLENGICQPLYRCSGPLIPTEDNPYRFIWRLIQWVA